MSQLPLHIDTHDRYILVVGGGAVACRKLRTLLSAHASVRVVSPVMNPEISALSASGAITARTGHYQASDLEGVFLAVAATNDAEVNRTIATDARQRGILAAVVDAPELSTCTFPAILRRGNLEISVSTGGRCPAFAALVRDVLSTVISDGYGIALEQLALEREKLLTEGNSSTYNKQILRAHAICLINELNEHKERVP
ncbi:MAG: bifunctional precorrin-2 dehydrogenase/sirohydrochlorin ferrochelatase [Pedobacter sp.]